MSYETTNPAGAQQLLQNEEGWTYLDVRSPPEYAQAHAPGAFNIPLLFRTSAGMQPNPNFVAAVEKHFPRDARLVVGCAAGVRSSRACDLLVAAGYTNLANMHGGFSGAFDRAGNLLEAGWQACGFETTADEEPERSWEALGG